MNICAVRTIIESIAAQGGISGMWWSSLKPHEPKSDHRFVMKPVANNKIDSHEWTGDYAECKHCNCVYAVEEGKAEG